MPKIKTLVIPLGKNRGWSFQFYWPLFQCWFWRRPQWTAEELKTAQEEMDQIIY